MQDLIAKLHLSPCLGTMPKLYAVTGDRHSGKTTAILDLYHRCRDAGLSVLGLCEVAVFDANGERLGYDFLELPFEHGAVGARFPVARKRDVAHHVGESAKMGYAFYDHAFLRAAECFSHLPPNSVVLIDEMGLLENTGKGLWPVFEALRGHQDVNALVAVVRRDILAELEKKMHGFDGICEI